MDALQRCDQKRIYEDEHAVRQPILTSHVVHVPFVSMNPGINARIQGAYQRHLIPDGNEDGVKESIPQHSKKDIKSKYSYRWINPRDGIWRMVANSDVESSDKNETGNKA